MPHRLFHLDSEMVTEKYSTRIYSPFPRQKYSSCCLCLHLRASPVIYNYFAPHVMIVGIGPITPDNYQILSPSSNHIYKWAREKSRNLVKYLPAAFSPICDILNGYQGRKLSNSAQQFLDSSYLSQVASFQARRTHWCVGISCSMSTRIFRDMQRMVMDMIRLFGMPPTCWAFVIWTCQLASIFSDAIILQKWLSWGWHEWMITLHFAAPLSFIVV